MAKDNGRRKRKSQKPAETEIVDPVDVDERPDNGYGRFNEPVFSIEAALLLTSSWLRSQSGRNHVILPEEVVKGFETIRQGIIDALHPLKECKG